MIRSEAYSARSIIKIKLSISGNATASKLCHRLVTHLSDKDRNDCVCSDAIELRSYLWQKLHEKAWKDIDVVYREAFGWTNLICYEHIWKKKSNYHEQGCLYARDIPVDELKQLLDMGILLGSDTFRSAHLKLLAEIASSSTSATATATADNATSIPTIKTRKSRSQRKKRQKVQPRTSTIPQYRLPRFLRPSERIFFNGYISRFSSPDLLSFFQSNLLPSVPVVLTDCMTDWKAIRDWADISYLEGLIGDRTVPVEVQPAGTTRGYLSEGAHQRLMRGREFIEKYLIRKRGLLSTNGTATAGAAADTAASSNSAPSRITQYDDESVHGTERDTRRGTTGEIAYLAQHRLLDQIPELLGDVEIPDYCALLTPADEEEVGEGGGRARDHDDRDEDKDQEDDNDRDGFREGGKVEVGAGEECDSIDECRDTGIGVGAGAGAGAGAGVRRDKNQETIDIGDSISNMKKEIKREKKKR
jgi:Cupin-like domain